MVMLVPTTLGGVVMGGRVDCLRINGFVRFLPGKTGSGEIV